MLGKGGVVDFAESDEQRMLRESVAALAARYGYEYFLAKARSGAKTSELWAEAGKAGFLGVAVPEEFGGGEELASPSWPSSVRSWPPVAARCCSSSSHPPSPPP
jgi:alkylation response protein AidB-like acyl-CoA dehydrogenase